MRISHSHGFVFISKPRCASTTIRRILDPHSDVISASTPPYHHHATALELKMHFDDMGWNWRNYFVFTTVRNPWDMMVSYYAKFRPDNNGIYNFEDNRDGIAYNPDNLMPFSRWIMEGRTHHRVRFHDGAFQRNIWVRGFSKLTLANTISDTNGESLVNRIVRVEDLEDQLPGILSSLGIAYRGTAGKLNTSARGKYRRYYNSRTMRRIAEEFESDLEYGKYEF